MEDVLFTPMQPEGQQQGNEGETPPPEQQQPEQQPEQPQQEEPGTAVPPAADTEKHVPLAALEAERKGRQDWKEKAIRAEAELEQLRRQQQQPREPVDPAQAYQQRLETVLLNASERAVRKEYGDETVNKAFARMQAEFAKNPALHHQVLTSADPWREAVTQGQKLIAMDEIGSDPAAYRAKLEAEIRASLQSQPQPSAAPNLPQSLAGARSAGARGTTFTGPTPFESIFPN